MLRRPPRAAENGAVRTKDEAGSPHPCFALVVAGAAEAGTPHGPPALGRDADPGARMAGPRSSANDVPAMGAPIRWRGSLQQSGAKTGTYAPWSRAQPPKGFVQGRSLMPTLVPPRARGVALIAPCERWLIVARDDVRRPSSKNLFTWCPYITGSDLRVAAGDRV